MNKIIEIGRSVRDPDIKYSGDTTIVKYTLAIPLNVLVNDYWEKSARKRIPKFIEDVISLYEAV